MEENENLEQQPSEEEQKGYVPRPGWQVWLARLCLVLFIAMIMMYMINIARGGL